MTTEYYTKTGNPQSNSSGSSSLIRSEFTAIEAGFAKLPAMTGNAGELVVVNVAGIALDSVAAGLTTQLLVGGGTGALPVWTVATGSGAPVRATSPTLVTPALGTPSSGTLTNCTGLPVAGGGTGRATGTTAYALIATGTSATGAQQSLAAGATTEILVGGGASALPVWTTATGSGAPVRATSPSLVTPVLGTPASGNLSSCTSDGTNAPGFLHVPQNSNSTDYTCVLSDAGKHIFHPTADANPRTFTIPSNASVAFPVGTALTFINQYQSINKNVTIAITTDTMRLAGPGSTGSRTLAVNGVATAIKVSSTEWIISGTNLT